jgi:hypothetical protein
VDNNRVAVMQRVVLRMLGAVAVGLFAYNEASNFRSCHRLLVQGASLIDAPFFMVDATGMQPLRNKTST